MTYSPTVNTAWIPAASLGCLKCKLVYKTQYIRRLRLVESCGLPEVRE